MRSQSESHLGVVKEVLLLVYNLALTSHPERQVALRKLEQGRVTVMSWEKLFLMLAEAGGALPEQPLHSDQVKSLAEPSKDLAYNWFMGASRARQLLAVVETVPASHLTQ